jgi:hypothetical protein
MELLDICLKITYFQFEDKFYQKEREYGNSLPPVVSNILMGHSEATTLDTADHKPIKWPRYVDDTFKFGHMDQQDCSNFFTISTALDPPSNSQWKWKLMILFLSWTSWL